MPWALLSDAERHLSSSMTGLLVAVGTDHRGGARPAHRWPASGSPRSAGPGLLIGLAGVAVLAGPDAVGGDAWPVAEVMLVAVCYATGPLIVNRKLGDLPGPGRHRRLPGASPRWSTPRPPP